MAWAKPPAPYTPRNVFLLVTVMFLSSISSSKGNLLSDQNETQMEEKAVKAWYMAYMRKQQPNMSSPMFLK